MKPYKTYKKQRYLFFWLSIIVYFVPYIVATACLLPLVRTGTGQRWAIGLAVVVMNALPFLAGIFRAFRAHFPFFNLPAFLFMCVAGFLSLEIFRNYVHIFEIIETVAAIGGIIACVLWHYHRKYARKAQTVKDVAESGLIGVGE